MMKSHQILILCVSAICSSLPLAASPWLPDYVPVKINQTEDAAFPSRLIAVGVKSGAASIAIAVDDSGKMTDYLVTAYTHPAFAESAVTALKKWTFVPAQIHGTPRNSKTDLTFHFEVEGVVVVSLSPLTYAELVRFKIAPRSLAYSACSLSELDQIPKPTKIVNPVYPTELARSSRGGHVAVEFYIDEEGHVRLPSVSRETIEANEELAAIAVTTVGQWEFEPPMSKGKPVLVKAQQDFNFKPAPDKSSEPKTSEMRGGLGGAEVSGISKLGHAPLAETATWVEYPFDTEVLPISYTSSSEPIHTKGNTMVSAKAFEGYVRDTLPDGSFRQETYAFGNGSRWDIAMVDQTMDHLTFDDVAQIIAGPLAEQNYVPAKDPQKTKLLIVVYWGTTSGSAEGPGFAIPTKRGNMVFGGGSTEMNDILNSRMLGFDFSSPLSPFKIDGASLRQEIEANRYFVGLVAYDFQLLWKQKVRKVLWVTRYSIREHRNEFDRDLPEVTKYASQFFGQDSHGFVVNRLQEGRVDVGPVRAVDSRVSY